MVVPKRAKKYSCTYSGCDKAYTRPCLLEEHKRSHDNTRPFSCDVCGKSFFRETHLQSHKWTHADTKPLGCTQCDKRFITNQQLQRHLKAHENKRRRKGRIVSSPDVHLSHGSSDGSGSLADRSGSTGEEESSENMSHPSPIKFDCPFNCGHSFMTSGSLGDHMLEEHIMTDTVDGHAHVKYIHDDLKKFDEQNQILYSWNGEDWTDRCCKEVECIEHKSFPNAQELMLHYSFEHAYVPDSLLQEYLLEIERAF